MVLMVWTGWPWFVADTRDTKKMLDDQKLEANSDSVPSIVIRTMPKKAMESMKGKEQVPQRHYLVVMRLRGCKAKLVFGIDSRSF
jgi:hypothetical protein